MSGKLGACIFGIVGFFIVLDVCATPLNAQSIEEKVQVCAGCHGQNGKPVDKTIAVIWGQQQGYRKNDIMQPIVSSMERADMLAIAEYFSKKPWPDLGQPRAPKEVANRALRANASVGCTGCHLDQFQGDGTVPRLAGMSRDYMTKTISDFRSRARGNNPGMSDLMLATAPDDLAALTEYLAGL